MNNLFFSPRAIMIRFAFLVLACFIAVGIAFLFSLPPVWNMLDGLMWGSLSQIVAILVLAKKR